MSYAKQTHVAGQKLTAAQLNHMENGIVAAQNIYNLLDNSDFRNPIAQAGYNAKHGTRKYVCDRWISWDADAVFENGYMTTGSPYDQPIEPAKIDTAKTYTAAVGLADGRIIAYSGNFANGFGYKASGIFGGLSTDNITPYVRIASNQNVVWAALYEGEYTAETLPSYVYKGYATELAECQRYYENSWFNSTKSTENEYMGVCVHASGLDAIIEYKVPKRIAATVTFYPTSPSETWRVYNDAGYRPLASVEAYARNGVRGFMVRGTKDTVNDTSVWAYGKAIPLFGQWEASADL